MNLRPCLFTLCLFSAFLSPALAGSSEAYRVNESKNSMAIQDFKETPTVSAFSQLKNTLAHTTKSIALESWEIGKIAGLAVAGGALYGIAHDQVTVRVCPEYFTRGFHQTNVSYWPDTGPLGIAKPILQTTKSPTVIACLWGVIATYELGLLCGGLIAFASRFGEKDKKTAKDFLKPMAISLAITGACSAIALNFPYDTDRFSQITVQGVPAEKLVAFSRCASAHKIAYTVAPLMMLVTAGWLLKKRLSIKNNQEIKNELLSQIKELHS